MRKFPSSRRAPRGRTQGYYHTARLQVETLESRLAPAVISIDAAANVHAIDPNIYGTAFATSDQLSDLNIPLNRNGGNASDTYSYAQDATNHGSDWYFESIASGTGNGQGMDSWITDTKSGGAQSSITLNILDWAAKLGSNRSILGSFPVTQYGSQQSTDPFWPNWGNGVHTNGSNITGNSPGLSYVANNSTIEKAWIQHLISEFGDSQHGGVQYYALGNEPGLWDSTHRDIHPNGDTLTELRDRVIAYASMVKSLDPNANILGFDEWGWTNYFISGADAAAQNWGATYNGLNAQEWLLDQLRQHDVTSGQRLLDYFTLHYYPQSGEFSDDVSTATELLRNRSTRSLWDPNYVDESWIGTTGINDGKVDLINQMKDWVSNYYPGTKLGVTEYNWGAEGNMNGATTQADVWGIFGRENLDLANRWTTPATDSPTYLAMKLYRNYDGSGSMFGDASVAATVPNPDQVSAFASVRQSDGALTVMVVNKNLYDSGNPGAKSSITLNLDNFAAGSAAQVWQLAATNPTNQNNAAITQRSNAAISGGSLTVSVPMESVTLFVIPRLVVAPPAAPTGLKAVAGDHRVDLTWKAVNGATSYRVYRSTTSGAETLLQSGLTTPSYTDDSANNGTIYFYKVSAVNSGGEGAQSAEASAMPQVTPPAAPTDLSAIAVSTTQINLTWTDNATNESNYIVERATDSGFTKNLVSATRPANATSYSAIGLTAGTKYYFRVQATNAGGDSAHSNVVSLFSLPPTGTGTGLGATYFNNANFTGATVKETDATVDFDWKGGSPVSGIGKDTFSVRWVGEVQALESGSYRFRTLSDQGVRLWINGQLLINDWSAHTLRSDTSAAVTLSAGLKYDIQMQYYDNTGKAVARLRWLRPGQSAYATVPQTQLYTLGNGLSATYYDNMDFTGATVSRIDPTVNFNWGSGAPVAGIGPDSFSVRWTGQIEAIESGTYTFRTYSDDGVRLWVNGQLLIDDWTNHGPTYDTGTIDLVSGQRYSIKLEYYDNAAGAIMELNWMRPGKSDFDVMPQTKLYSA